MQEFVILEGVKLSWVPYPCPTNADDKAGMPCSIKQGIISLERMMETVCMKDAETTYRSSGYRKDAATY